MNNKLPACFSTLKPRLPEITEHYEIRNPVFHLPAIKHKFAENSLQYCLTKLINEEHSFSMMSDKVEKHRFIVLRYLLSTEFMIPIKVHAILSNSKLAPQLMNS